jgi:hypothetical protein
MPIKKQLTIEQKDTMYLHLMCAAVTGLASRTDDVLQKPKYLAAVAAEIADNAFDLCVIMHEAHCDDEEDALRVANG